MKNLTGQQHFGISNNGTGLSLFGYPIYNPSEVDCSVRQGDKQ